MAKLSGHFVELLCFTHQNVSVCAGHFYDGELKLNVTRHGRKALQLVCNLLKLHRSFRHAEISVAMCLNADYRRARVQQLRSIEVGGRRKRIKVRELAETLNQMSPLEGAVRSAQGGFATLKLKRNGGAAAAVESPSPLTAPSCSRQQGKVALIHWVSQCFLPPSVPLLKDHPNPGILKRCIIFESKATLSKKAKIIIQRNIYPDLGLHGTSFYFAEQ